MNNGNPNGQTTIHILACGQVLCTFTPKLPKDWPQGNHWVPIAKYKEANCTGCLSALNQDGDPPKAA